MPCGNIGDDEDDFAPNWWNRIEPLEKPDDPNSFMSKLGDTLGDTIDFVSETIVNTAVMLSGVPLFLYMYLTGTPWKGGCCVYPDEE